MIPCFKPSIFSMLTSTQVTLIPISEKHVPETSPTYPVPTIAIFIYSILFHYLGFVFYPFSNNLYDTTPAIKVYSYHFLERISRKFSTFNIQLLCLLKIPSSQTNPFSSE